MRRLSCPYQRRARPGTAPCGDVQPPRVRQGAPAPLEQGQRPAPARTRQANRHLTRRPDMRPICAPAAWLYGKGCPIPGFVPARLHIDCILASTGAKRPRLASAYLCRLLYRLRERALVAAACSALRACSRAPSPPVPCSPSLCGMKCPRWDTSIAPLQNVDSARMYCPGNRLAHSWPSLNAYTSSAYVVPLMYALPCCILAAYSLYIRVSVPHYALNGD